MKIFPCSVAPLLGCLGLLLAGCLGSSGSNRDASEPDNEPPYRLRVENQSEQEVAIEVILTELTAEGEPSNEPTTESYTLDAGSRISLDRRIEPSTSYEATVRIEGGTSGSWYLYTYAGITVEIKSLDKLETLVVEV